MKTSTKRWRAGAAVACIALMIAACTATLGLTKIEISVGSITLAWDPPEETAESIPVASYRVYYRVHPSEDWLLVSEVDAVDEPEYTLAYLDLGLNEDKADLDFAVTSVGVNGLESLPHWSGDEYADQSGWYLVWEPAG